MEIIEILDFFKQRENKHNAEGMMRFGVGGRGKLYGIKIPDLRGLAKKIGTDHKLAEELWKYEIHEAKLLATMIADKAKIDNQLMESWVLDLYSWDICDQLIMNYFGLSPMAKAKALEWCTRPEEFVKRAGFVLMAKIVVSDKKASDEDFYDFFDYLKSESSDNRNMV
ncbi:MAG: DNA alkylation repair protein, partial [Bacteroidota bacterium]